MGTITLSKANRLFWLGRYTERVFTSIQATLPIFEAETDGQEADFNTYCEKIGIPKIYNDTAHFCKTYCFDESNPNSIVTNLNCAYDNAVVLRETISSATLAYIHLALNAMTLGSQSSSPAVEMQWVLDDIMAFRGSCDEQIEDETIRNIIRTGASLERVDLYLRLGYDSKICEKEFNRFFNRLYKTRLHTDDQKLRFLVDAILDKKEPMPAVNDLLYNLEALFDEM